MTRIYVASLSDYNAGRLHGKWIDLDNDLDDVWTEIHAMLAASPEKRICQWCGGKMNEDGTHIEPKPHEAMGGNAEEWAIHDSEGFEGYEVSEYESIEKVHAVAQGIEAHGAAFATWLEDCDGDVENLDRFVEQYVGEFESRKAFAEHMVEQVGFGGLTPKQLEGVWGYLDFEHIANEFRIGGDFSLCEENDPFRIYVFQTS